MAQIRTRFKNSQPVVNSDTVREFLVTLGIDISTTFIRTQVSDGKVRLLEFGSVITPQQKAAIVAKYPELAEEVLSQ